MKEIKSFNNTPNVPVCMLGQRSVLSTSNYSSVHVHLSTVGNGRHPQSSIAVQSAVAQRWLLILLILERLHFELARHMR